MLKTVVLQKLYSREPKVRDNLVRKTLEQPVPDIMRNQVQ